MQAVRPVDVQAACIDARVTANALRGGQKGAAHRRAHPALHPRHTHPPVALVGHDVKVPVGAGRPLALRKAGKARALGVRNSCAWPLRLLHAGPMRCKNEAPHTKYATYPSNTMWQQDGGLAAAALPSPAAPEGSPAPPRGRRG